VASTCENFLLDTCRLIRDEAEEARAARDLLHGKSGDQGAYLFQAGRTAAYHEMLTLLLHEAEAFGLDATALGLKGYDPDAALL